MTEQSHAERPPKEEEWQHTLASAEAVRAAGGYVRYAEQHPNEIAQTVVEAPNCVCCMDERVVSQVNGVAVAGSGILIKDDSEKRQAFIQGLKDQGIKKVYLHSGCGAIALYGQMMGLTPEQAEADALAWAKQLETELGGDGAIETLGVKPEGFHNAQALYLAFTSNFSIKNAETLPPGFIVSALAVGMEHALAQVDVAINKIALGAHAFGDRFTKETPFTIVVVAANDEQLASVMNDMRLKALLEPHNGRVALDGFVAPAA